MSRCPVVPRCPHTNGRRQFVWWVVQGDAFFFVSEGRRAAAFNFALTSFKTPPAAVKNRWAAAAGCARADCRRSRVAIETDVAVAGDLVGLLGRRPLSASKRTPPSVGSSRATRPPPGGLRPHRRGRGDALHPLNIRKDALNQ